MIKKKPFVNYTLDEKKKESSREILPISINKEERKRLDQDKKILQQSKDSTALKQLAELGHIVLHDDLTGKILRVILKNRYKNKRIGIVDYE